MYLSSVQSVVNRMGNGLRIAPIGMQQTLCIQCATPISIAKCQAAITA